MRIRVVFCIFSAICILFTGCSPKESGGERVQYEETKKMVVDILKTDEGKKAIQDVMSDEKVKSQMVMDQKVVSSTIEQSMTSDKAKEFWQKAFDDPKFASAYAKGLRQEHESLLKDLMKDPQYRGMLMEVMQDPELQKELRTLIKSKAMRDETKRIMLETMDSPLAQEKIQDILMQAAEQMQSQKKQEGGS
ncbi:spore gernimation protein GerD [Peribacillus saganii]|uniref:Spore gernimation protein GerD n=1 Tax=Peribacillus saganii TaxID=2303992 RepID=A0A372LMJ2_9BACI|nr:spore germination lipoprotein GerD [Peribacillus saganii]RFU68585.1 spore gernimation protein GerD [Peribacillus saganii]